MQPLLLRTYARYARAIAQDPNGGQVSVIDLVRLYPRWRVGIGRKGSPIDQAIPWTTYASIEFFKKLLKPTSRVFEFGSGGSTLFFAKRCEHLVSVEHDPAWGIVVREALTNQKLSNVDYRVVEPTEGVARLDPSNVTSYASASDSYLDSSFEAYVRVIEEFPDASFDLVVVDGRARPSCILASLAKVKPNGWIVLDNAERDRYQQAQCMLVSSGWKSTRYIGPGPCNEYFWVTSAWQRSGR